MYDGGEPTLINIKMRRAYANHSVRERMAYALSLYLIEKEDSFRKNCSIEKIVSRCWGVAYDRILVLGEWA